MKIKLIALISAINTAFIKCSWS